MKRFLAILILGCSCLLAGAFPDKPVVEGPVNDLAHLLTDDQVLELQHMLVDFADSTSNQILFLTVNSLEGMDASSYAIKIGLEWKVGDDQFNNGIVFLVKPKTADSAGEAFIAVGRGLEGVLPDITCHRIVRDIAIPYFAEGDYYGGIKAACLRLMELSASEYHSPYASDEDDFEDDLGVIIFLILILTLIIAVAVILVKHSGGSGGGNGSGGSGGRGRPFIYVNPSSGSFSGRSGGSFGGGGFSGGFSGGFGGGSFGGGGGGARW